MTRAPSVLAIACVLFAAGCSRTPTAPSDLASPVPTTPTSVTLTVRVLARGSETPIAGADVVYNGTNFSTDASGQLQMAVARDQEATLAVSAAGYAPMTASAVVGGSERWTFYLLPIS